jgi:hypothetical protein
MRREEIDAIVSKGLKTDNETYARIGYEKLNEMWETQFWASGKPYDSGWEKFFRKKGNIVVIERKILGYQLRTESYPNPEIIQGGFLWIYSIEQLDRLKKFQEECPDCFEDVSPEEHLIRILDPEK